MNKDVKPVATELYTMWAYNGKPIRKATKVIFNTGHEVLFSERMSKKTAFEQASRYIENRALREVPHD